MDNLKPPSRAAILSFIEADARLLKIFRFVEIQHFDQAHDIDHFLRVARWAKHIIDAESAPEHENFDVYAVAAALLHDLKNLPKNHPLRGNVSADSARAARLILLDAGFVENEADIITDAIRVHSFSRNERACSPVEKALQDADRLDAMGSIGLMRCISTSAQIGSEYFNETDPWALHRSYDDMAYALDHVLNRLVLLPELMNTATAREEATARLEIMQKFLLQLGHEIDVKPPEKVTDIRWH